MLKPSKSGLFLDGCDPLTPGVRLRFDDTDGLPIVEEDGVGGGGIGKVFAHCDARSGVEIYSNPALHTPDRNLEAIIDAVECHLFGSLVHYVRHAMVRHARP